jgi:DNA-binding PadR family transcriptional regulator
MYGHCGGRRRAWAERYEDYGAWRAWRGRHGGRHGRGGWGRRFFEHGALRIIALGLIAERPRNGYEIIKAIEEKTGGAYAPSPGVVYPALSLLEEQGHIVQVTEDGKKLWAITPEGKAALDANKRILEAFEERFADKDEEAGRSELRRAVRRLVHAVRAKVASGEIDETSVGTLVAAIDAAAEAVEKA